MAKKTVDITVKIKDKFSKKIQSLKRQLRTIQNRIDVDLELDDNGDINWAKMELESIDDFIDVLLSVSDGELEAALAKIKAIDNQEITVDVDYDDNGFERRMRNFSRFDSPSVPPPADFVGGVRKLRSDGDGWSAISRMGKSGLPDTVYDKSDLPAVPDSSMGIEDEYRSSRIPDMDMRGMGYLRSATGVDSKVPDMDLRDVDRKDRRSKVAGWIGSITSGTGSLDKTLKRMFPTMRKWMNLIAALIPMMITFATGLLGVAAAMGTVAVAGGAMLGIGLLGYGDSLEGSMEGAQQRVKEFKKELFRTFQGSIGTFNPITERFMNYLPSELGSLDSTLTGFTVFEDDLFAGTGGAIDWLERFIDLSVELEPQISQLSAKFGKITGNQILDFFRWLTEEAYRNQDAIVELGSLFKDLGMILYNVSKFVSFVALEFAPLINFVTGLSNLLGNKLAQSLVAAAAKGYILAKALGAVLGAAKALQAMSGPAGWLSLAIGAGIMEFGMSDASNLADNDVGVRQNSRAGNGGNTFVMNNHGPTQQKHISEFESIASANDVQFEQDNDWQERP